MHVSVTAILSQMKGVGQSRLLMLLLLAISCVSNADEAINITHIPSEAIKLGQRLNVSASFTEGIELKTARLYFKSNQAKFFSFIPLTVNGNLNGTLPAAVKYTNQLHYYFVLQLESEDILQSNVYSVEVLPVMYQGASAYDKALNVYSEYKDELEEYHENVEYIQKGADLLDKLNLASRSGYSVGSSSQAVSSLEVVSSSTNSNLIAGQAAESTATSSSATSSATSASAATTGTTTTAAATTAAVSTTTVVAGVGVAVGGAAIASGSEDEEETSEEEPDYSGTYTLEITGSLISELFGICNSNATLRILNVVVQHSDNDLSLTAGSFEMNGVVSGIQLSINAGSGDVSGSTVGFASTDTLKWQSFNGSFSGSDSFSSNSFEMTTAESGVDECIYQASITASK